MTLGIILEPGNFSQSVERSTLNFFVDPPNVLPQNADADQLYGSQKKITTVMVAKPVRGDLAAKKRQ